MCPRCSRSSVTVKMGMPRLDGASNAGPSACHVQLDYVPPCSLHSRQNLPTEIPQFQTLESSAAIVTTSSKLATQRHISFDLYNDKCAGERPISPSESRHVVKGNRREMSLFGTTSRSQKGDILATLFRPSLLRKATDRHVWDRRNDPATR